MTFLPYENVPLYLSEKGKDGEYIFAERASLNINQSVQADRQIDDNIIQIASYNDGSTINYSEHTFLENQETLITLGPIGGPPRPIATSIYSIQKDSKITFPETGSVTPSSGDNSSNMYLVWSSKEIISGIAALILSSFSHRP